MSTKTRRWIFVLSIFLFVLLLAILSAPVSASAAQETGTTSNSCLTCHEDLYYLHDSGKLYCLSNHTDRCTNCHEGNAAAMKKEESHLGLIVRPQENSGEKCLECHTAQVAQERLSIFASEGGFSTAIKADVYTPSTEPNAGFPDIHGVDPLPEKLPWLVGAFVIFGFWLMLVLFSPLKP